MKLPFTFQTKIIARFMEPGELEEFAREYEEARIRSSKKWGNTWDKKKMDLEKKMRELREELSKLQ